MRRQLRANGGIMNARQGYGLGSWVKEKVRKIIPNELADIAVKAAPFVAMIPGYGPAVAGVMRGVGRFDQRGSIGDALKQGVGTYAGGELFNRGMTSAGFRDAGASGYKEFLNQGTKDSIGGFFQGTEGTGTNNFLSEGNAGAKKFAEDQGKGFMEKTTDKIFDKIPFGKKLNQAVKEKLLVGGVTSAATYLYEKFVADYPEPEPGEDMAVYMAERRQRVGTQMRTYMDNYLAYDPQYSAMSDAEKDAFVERNNKNMGGLMRRNYQTGGISMTNTAAQNKRINDAQRQTNQGIMEAARARLPGYVPSSINYQGKLEQQNNFGGLPSGVEGGNMVHARPSGQNTSQTLDAQMTPAVPTLSADYLSQLKDIRDQQTSSGMSGDDLIPEYSQYDVFNLGPNQGAIGGGQQGQIDYLKQGVGQGLSYEQIMDNYNDEQYAKMQADDLKYGSFADGRTIDPGAGRASYNDLLNVFKYDHPNVTLTGNETLAELDQMLLDRPSLYNKGGRVNQNMGGLMRLNYMIGGEAKQMEAGAPPIMYSGNMDPNAQNQQAGLPSIPGPMQMAQDGPEFDMRENGGFQPLGRQEGKDDVPAMLAKNEFVMTADAVRAAGGGSIQKGAQKMYNTMKKLESRVS